MSQMSTADVARQAIARLEKKAKKLDELNVDLVDLLQSWNERGFEVSAVVELEELIKKYGQTNPQSDTRT